MSQLEALQFHFVFQGECLAAGVAKTNADRSCPIVGIVAARIDAIAAVNRNARYGDGRFEIGLDPLVDAVACWHPSRRFIIIKRELGIVTPKLAAMSLGFQDGRRRNFLNDRCGRPSLCK